MSPILSKCQKERTDPIIPLEENKIKVTFNNSERNLVNVVTVDGCAITEGIRCDYLLIDSKTNEHYIELKGSDIYHALKQIENSIALLKAADCKNRSCYIIYSPTFTFIPTNKIQDYEKN